MYCLTKRIKRVHLDPSLLLTELGSQLKIRLVGAPWEYAHIDGFVSSSTSINTIAMYASTDDFRTHSFRFPKKENDEVEHIFTQFHALMVNTDARWNKARFTYRPDINAHLFEHYYDPDYQWLTSLNVDGLTYEKFPIEEEVSITAWEGLPPEHPRPRQKAPKHRKILNHHVARKCG